MRALRTVLLFALVFLLCFSFAGAEEKKGESGYEAYSLGEIYVTGEKTPVTQQTTISNTITAEDIKATNSRTVSEALSFAPGISVTTGTKNEPNISIHGFFDQSRILVLIDGVPYYETKYGKLDLSQFTTDNVAKIEVTKGAASVLYGANAEGGVINIITKQASGKPFFSVNLEGGDVDYFKASVSHGMKKGIFNYWLNYDHQQAHGWNMSNGYTPVLATITPSGFKPARPAYKAVTESGGTRKQSDYATDSFWAKFGIEPTAGSEYFLNFHYVDKEKGNPPSTRAVRVMPTFSNFFRYSQYKDWGIDLSGNQKINDKLTFTSKVFYHNHVDSLDSYSNENFNSIIARSNYRDYMVGGSLITQYQLNQWNTMRLAFNYRGDSHRQRDLETSPFLDFFALTGSVGLEDEINISKNFSLVVGASYDWFGVTEANKAGTTASSVVRIDGGPSKDSFNPMGGVTYTLSDSTKLFASIAQKSRFPTLDQLFSSSSGNNTLKPEIALNSTIGVSRAISKYMWGELSFFSHDITDFMSRPDRNSAYVNIGQVMIYGIELNTEFYPVQDLILKVAYNYNHAADKSKNRVTDMVLYVPEYKFDLGASYTVPYAKTRLDLNGIVLGKTYTQLPSPSALTTAAVANSGYFTMNARVSQKFLKNFEAYIALNNILDKNYEPEIGYPAQGRNIFGGITAKF